MILEEIFKHLRVIFAKFLLSTALIHSYTIAEERQINRK